MDDELSRVVDGFRRQWPFPTSPTTAYKWKSRATMCLVYFTSKLMFPVLNKIKVDNRETFINALEDCSRPLITVSNHRCNIDDPLVWTFTTTAEFFRNIDRWRYILTAHNICFTKRWHTTLFSLGRCVPCVRGAGVYQPGVDLCVNALNEGGWVHVFPEGRVTQEAIRIKWGVGRMIAEARQAPLLLPIWVEGMTDVWPREKPYYPKVGNVVNVRIGQPIDTTEIRNKCKHSDQVAERKCLADFVQDKLFALGNCKPVERPADSANTVEEPGLCGK